MARKSITAVILSLTAVALSLGVALVAPSVASASCYPPPCTPAPLQSHPQTPPRVVIQSGPAQGGSHGVLGRTGSSFALPLLAAAAGLTILGGSLLVLVRRPKAAKPVAAVIS